MTDTDTLARINDLEPSVSGTLQLPPANQVGVGQDILFNAIAGTIDIYDLDNNFLATVSAGEVKYFYLTDNSTTVGVWKIFTFGTGTSGADASLLAGRGLKAISNKLSLNYPTSDTTADQSIDSQSARAEIFNWTGGVGTFTLDSIAVLLDGFWFGVRNNGTGVITVVPDGSDTINGAASLALNPGDSCFIIASSDTLDWLVLGLGRAIEFAFSLLVKDISAGGVIDLSNSEAANKIIQLAGTPISTTSVNVPAVPSVYWVNNQAGGAEIVYFGITGVADFQVQVLAGQHTELVCTGTQIYVAIDGVGGSGTFLFQFGSLGAPSITFAGDTSFGLYHDNASEWLNFTVDGSFDNVVLTDNGIMVANNTNTSIYGPGFLNLGSNSPPTTCLVRLIENMLDVADSRLVQGDPSIDTVGSTTELTMFSSEPSSSNVVVPLLNHFRAKGVTLSGGGTAPNQIAFRGEIAAGAGQYNLYLDGDAKNYLAGNLSVGTLTPDASACLQAFSTTQGFLPPRMTTTQRDAIAGPLGGLLIYNTTTNKLNVRGAVGWEVITSV